MKKDTGENATFGLEDNVEISMYDVESVTGESSNWDDLNDSEKIELLESQEPVHRGRSHNVLTQTYREHVARLVNPDENETPIEASHIAFGDDGSATSLSDEHLKNEVFRTPINEHINRGAEMGTVTLLGADDGVGFNLLEAGLVSTDDPASADDAAVNRVLLDDPENRLQPKTTDHAVTVKVDIVYKDESEVTA